MPGLLRGRIHSLDQNGGTLRVVVPSESGDLVRPAFGRLPDAAPGDLVRLDRDERNRLVAVAWQPAA